MAKLFNLLNEHLEAAKAQGFRWDKLEYEFKDLPQGDECQVAVKMMCHMISRAISPR